MFFWVIIGKMQCNKTKVLHPLPSQLVPTTGSLTALRTTCVTSLIGAACQKLDHRVSTSNQFQSLARRCQVQLGLLEVNKCKKIVELFFPPGFVLCPPVPATAVASLRIVLNVSSSDQGAGIQTRSAMILLKVSSLKLSKYGVEPKKETQKLTRSVFQPTGQNSHPLVRICISLFLSEFTS